MKILEKLQALFADSKMRIVMILFILLLVGGTVTGIVFAIRYMTGPLGADAGAQLKEAPQIKSTVGGWHNDVSPEYRRSQEQFNREQVEKAIKTGTSAMPSLIDSKAFPAGMDPSKFGSGTGFQQLKLSEQEEGQTKGIGDTTTGTVTCGDPAQVMGRINANGEIKDANGKVLCKIQSNRPTASVPSGTLVYDPQGNVIGTVASDGTVRDASGKVVGRVGTDGVVRDVNGNIIGKAGAAVTAGALIYDDKGNVIGSVGPDGLVRDKTGTVIGKAGPDGVVRDASGNIIGKAGTGAAVGALVYDDKGNILGSIGPDGLVRDKTGAVVGKVGPDGVVRDQTGKVIGKAGTAGVGVGALVYGPDGKLIGRVGVDGLVHDPVTGAVLGKVGPDGVLRDANGKEEGRVGAPPAIAAAPTPAASATPVTSPAAATSALLPSIGAPTSPNDAADARLKAAMQRQDAAMTEQQRAQMQQQVQSAMTAQANQLFTAWAPPTQDYVAGSMDDKDNGKGGSGGEASGAGGRERLEGRSGASGKKPLLVKAGAIVFAVLDTAVNTDEPGPILATIVEGKLKGYRLMGKVDRVEKKAMLTFTLLTGAELPSKVTINTVAIDPDTARTGLASDVDSHYWLRYGSLFGSALLQGYSTALMSSGATTTVNPLGGTVTATPVLSPQQKLLSALGTVGTRYQAVMGSNFNTPPTVTINSGVGLAILFLDDVAEPAA